MKRFLLVLTIIGFLCMPLFVSSTLSCPLFIRENAVYMTNMEVTPVNVAFDRIYDAYSHGMPHLTLTPNEKYTLDISFRLNDLAAVFLKILRFDWPPQSSAELYKAAFPASTLRQGWNSFVISLQAPEITDEFCVSVIGVAGNCDDDDPHFGEDPEDWNCILFDGCFAGRKAQELNWFDYEVAFRFHVKVEGDWSLYHHNPVEPMFMQYLSAIPSKTLLLPSESFETAICYYRTTDCPTDYVKIFYKSEETGEIWEVGRWAAPFAGTIPEGWGPLVTLSYHPPARQPYWPPQYPYNLFWIVWGLPLTRTLAAPTTPGTYTVRVVGCSGYPIGVYWDEHIYWGALWCHKPEELSWTFYEQMAEFSIEVMPPAPPRCYLDIQTSPLGITTIPAQGWYDESTTVTIEAPQHVDVLPGLVRYRFDHWDVDGLFVEGNPINVHMDATYTATAHYVQQYYLSVDTEPRLLSPAPTGEGWYDECTFVTLIALSTSYYMDTKPMDFDCWTVEEGIALENSITIHMDSPHIAIAHYYISAIIDINPNTLNLETYVDKWVTCYMELTEGWNVAEIDRASILLNGTLPVDPFWVDKPLESVIGDYDSDTIQDLMVKFDREAVVKLIMATAKFDIHKGHLWTNITLTITGRIYSGILFKGNDIITAIIPARWVAYSSNIHTLPE